MFPSQPLIQSLWIPGNAAGLTQRCTIEFWQQIKERFRWNFQPAFNSLNSSGSPAALAIASTRG
jgi:hypothetical protein